MNPCPSCVVRWIDEACSATGIELVLSERQQLTAALLARRHLILSGPKGIGKLRFANALASAMAQNRTDHVRWIQGHPWWAADTGDVSRYVMMQTDLSLWRLADFLEPILATHPASPPSHDRTGEIDFVVGVERMSASEIDLYYGQFAPILVRQATGGARLASQRIPLRLIGTYDSPAPPALDDQMKRLTALVHLGGVALTPATNNYREQKRLAA